ncbi:MAG: DUF2959 family protein [Planctomycetes bacterium]|nr:DUF2959 family protein [Planctomycetota bacterium]
MHPRKQRLSFVVLSLLTACASGSGRQHDPAKVDDLITTVEQVHVEAERARDAIAASFERLNALAAGRFGTDPAAVVYARFVQSIDAAEQQALRFREHVAPMLEASEPVFTSWREDIATISSERLRQRSELRYAVAKERYDAVATSAVQARDRFDGYVAALRDHATFLAHDLNPSSIDEIQEEVKLVAQTAQQLDRELEATMAAAHAYVDGSSLPVAAPLKGN